MASPGASRREATRQEVAKRDGGARHRAASCAGTGRRQEKGVEMGWAGWGGTGPAGGLHGWLPGKSFSVFYFYFSSVFFFLILLPLF